jgi:hypothetical protein
MAENLYNLFVNPFLAWKNIEMESYKSSWQIILKNLFIFLLINPLLFLLINIFSFKTWKLYLMESLLDPFIFTFIGIAFITSSGLILEEIFRITSYREPGQNFFKLLVFSFLPLFSLFGFSEIPVIGKILLFTGLGYSFYLLHKGFSRFVWPNKSGRRTVFIISSFLGISGLIIATGIILGLLNLLKII